MRVRFGDFVFDRGTRQLRRGEEERPLGPKAFELLDLLLSQRPNVIARERVRARLWPSVAVSESTLATVVADLRAALEDDARQPRFLRTVHGVGYAFCGEAAALGPSGRGLSEGPTAYRLVLRDREVALHPGENLLGRVENGVVWLDSPTVSRRHARIVIEGGTALLEDLGSKNGTFVGEKRVAAPVPLVDGDVFRVGRVSMTFRAQAADQATHTDRG
jgi:DNA-binding winged helix-turn-helix (wHTH) protein